MKKHTKNEKKGFILKKLKMLKMQKEACNKNMRGGNVKRLKINYMQNMQNPKNAKKAKKEKRKGKTANNCKNLRKLFNNPQT